MIIIFDIIYIYILDLQVILRSLTQVRTHLVKSVKSCGTSKVHGTQWPPFGFESYNANNFSWKCRIEDINADSDPSSNFASFGTWQFFKKSNKFLKNFEILKFKVLKFTKGRKGVCEILICTQNIKYSRHFWRAYTLVKYIGSTKYISSI